MLNERMQKSVMFIDSLSAVLVQPAGSANVLGHFKDVTPLPCKTKKYETGKIWLHVMQ